MEDKNKKILNLILKGLFIFFAFALGIIGVTYIYWSKVLDISVINLGITIINYFNIAIYSMLSIFIIADLKSLKYRDLIVDLGQYFFFGFISYCYALVFYNSFSQKFAIPIKVIPISEILYSVIIIFSLLAAFYLNRGFGHTGQIINFINFLFIFILISGLILIFKQTILLFKVNFKENVFYFLWVYLLALFFIAISSFFFLKKGHIFSKRFIIFFKLFILVNFFLTFIFSPKILKLFFYDITSSIYILIALVSCTILLFLVELNLQLKYTYIIFIIIQLPLVITFYSNRLFEGENNFLSNLITSLKSYSEIVTLISVVIGILGIMVTIIYPFIRKNEKKLQSFEQMIIVNREQNDYGEAWLNFEALVDLGLEVKYYDAEKNVRKLLEKDNSKHLWYSLGTSLGKQNKYSDAVDALNKAIELDNLYSDAIFDKGSYLFDLEDYPNSESAFKRVTELDKKDKYAWFNLGLALFNQNEINQAKKAIEEALNLDKSYSSAWRMTGRIANNQGFFKDAENAYKKAIKTNKKDIFALYGLAYALDMQKKYSDSVKILAQLIKYKKNDSSLWNDYGSTLKKLNYIKKAEYAMRKSIRLNKKVELTSDKNN